ncbi:MAG: dehydrogenase [Peptococcaceae bacterium]|jgi:TorA maturation chaperone TorD|nr:dehydrogenase [Peptococcaceae bacterium]
MTLSQEQAYAYLLQLFADLLKFPDEELYDQLLNGDIDSRINKLGAAAGKEIRVDFRPEIGSYDSLVHDYNNCFLGFSGSAALPVESLYKVWTVDQSYHLPYKNEKGHLMSDSALHIRHILQELQLEIPPEYELMPDHLVILLELKAYFLANGLFEEAIQFCREHLDWLDEYYSILKAKQPQSFYLKVIRKLNEILH